IRAETQGAYQHSMLMSHGSTAIRYAAAVVMAVLAGCRGPTPELPATVVRDSAGVEIVENHGAAWTGATAWRLSSEPEVRMGTVSGATAYEFAGVVGLTRMTDGRIVVLDQQSR